MLKHNRRPNPLMILALLAVVVFLVLAACVRVDGDEEDDCDDVGLSAVEAPASSRPRPAVPPAKPAAPPAKPVKPADRPRVSVSKAPAASTAPRRTPSPVATTTSSRPGHRPAHGHGHGDLDLDLCDD
ncbi:hypothetical protein [Streptomyces sp. NBC_00443]|uniref:hypothetical protein n=1 Tax=Streptomyces sp. NBC_00443 TaxID=2975743 RepID=UPI002E1AC1DA